MDNIKLALLQIKPTSSLEENIIKGRECCKKAKSMGADIILFPEMWSNGYNIYNRLVNEWINEAIDIDSKFIKEFKKLAKELEVAIGITFLEKCSTGPKNSIILFDMQGNSILHYSKVHTCDFDVEANLTPGDDFYVADLVTSKGIVKVGSMICYDREFPESARILMLKGAELVLVPNACPMEINRLSQLRGRAYENMMVIATCNYPIDVPDCNGNSSVFDGVAYLPELSGSRDTCLFQAGPNEDIYLVDIDLDMVRRYREEEVHGNAYRRPNKYKILLDEEVNYPFIRENKRNLKG